MNQSFTTPILLIIFNRPDTTLKVFNEIKKVKPTKLYVVADGPRIHKEGEKKLCTETQRIIDFVDWDCQVHTNYSNINLGCKKRVSSGINWFFEHEERGIILEDDCLPNQSFFRFCEEMLEVYKNNEAIGMVSGNNFQFGRIINMYDCYFSRYTHIWGWATWRRAWKKYDVTMSEWPQVKKSGVLKNIFGKIKDTYYWSSIFDDVYAGNIDTWDYQWTFTCFINNYLSVMPRCNLVSNIGFDSTTSTHTKRKSKFANMPTTELLFPLKTPNTVTRDAESDKIVQRDNYPFWRHIVRKILLQ